MAEVFAGYALGSHGFQKPVAIKRLLPELANDHVFVDRLIGEAKLLVGMTHGNIVSVVDLARDGEDVFLVMEYVDGPSLRQLIKARGSHMLSLGIASYIVQSAAAGLEFAHVRPGGAIIHADISPSNLLLTTSGEVRVADFGIARREGAGEGIVEGKWAYMAPEQARGEPLTPRCDVFALGVVLYELITGRHPFGGQVSADGRDEQAIRVVPPRVVNPSVPPGLDAICMRMLATDPLDRYARMQHVIDAIVDERFANGWRESASDLASAIRECGAGPAAVPQMTPRTMITERPLTIVTRSLISEPHRGSEPAIPAPRGSEPAVPVLDSGARTRMIEIAAEPPPVVPAIVSPAILPPPLDIRAEATPPPPRLSAKVLPNPELASVHGGNTLAADSLRLPARNLKWVLAILGAGAMIGIAAAVVLEVLPDPSDASPPTAQLTVSKSEPEVAAVAPPPAPTAAATEPPAAAAEKPVVPPPPPPVETAPKSAETAAQPAETAAPAPTPPQQPPAPTPPQPSPSPTSPPPPPTPAMTTDTPAPPSPAKPAPRHTHAPSPSPSTPRRVREQAPAGTGSLVVSSIPYARVTVDGEDRGETVPRLVLSGLSLGHHTIVLENGRTGAIITRHVQISVGKLTELVVGEEEWPRPRRRGAEAE